MLPIVITTYKNPERLEKCISHILPDQQQDVIVVDNSEDNRLYTKGMNFGIKQALKKDWDYILLLTDDAFMTKTTMGLLEEVMKNFPKCGIVSPIHTSEKQITWAGSTKSWPFGIHANMYPNQAAQTYWVNGTCMLLRRSMMEEIGLLDENMKFICSDSDYSMTARSRGWECWFTPHATVEHKLDGSGSFGKNPFLDQIKLEDATYFTNKWLSGGLFKSLEFQGQDITNGKVKQALIDWSVALRRLEKQKQSDL